MYQQWKNLEKQYTAYQLGAKGVTGGIYNKLSGLAKPIKGEMPQWNDSTEIDCSGAVCEVSNTFAKEKGINIKDIQKTNATKLFESGTPIKEYQAGEGAYVYLQKEGAENHIAQIVMGPDGTKYLAESASPDKFTGVAMTPYDTRMKELKKAGFNVKFSMDDELFGDIKQLPPAFATQQLMNGGYIKKMANGGDINEGWTAEQVQLALNHWTTDQNRRESPIDAEMLLNLANEYNIPIELALAQASTESWMGIQDRSFRSNNPFNVGNTDPGDNMSYEDSVAQGYTIEHDTIEGGLRAYFELMQESYAPESGDYYDLVRGEFVNQSGNRYASNTGYENLLTQNIDTISRIAGTQNPLAQEAETTPQAETPETTPEVVQATTPEAPEGTYIDPVTGRAFAPNVEPTIPSAATPATANPGPFQEQPVPGQAAYDRNRENVNNPNSIPMGMEQSTFNAWAAKNYEGWDNLNEDARDNLYDNYNSKIGRTYSQYEYVYGPSWRKYQKGEFDLGIVEDWNGYVVEGGRSIQNFHTGETIYQPNPKWNENNNLNRPLQNAEKTELNSPTPIKPVIPNQITIPTPVRPNVFTPDPKIEEIAYSGDEAGLFTDLEPDMSDFDLLTGNILNYGQKPNSVTKPPKPPKPTDPNLVMESANGPDWLRYAPIAGDIANIGMILGNKPDNINAGSFQIQDEYRKQQIDKELLQREADIQSADLRTAIAEGATTQTGLMNAISAISAGTAKAKTDAVMKGQLFDAEQGQIAEQYERQADQFNKGVALNVQNMNDANDAAYLGNLMDSITNLTNNLGLIGKEEWNANQLKATTGIDPRTSKIVNQKVFDAYARSRAAAGTSQTVDQRKG